MILSNQTGLGLRKSHRSILACCALTAGLLLTPCASIAQELPLYTQWVNYDEANGFPEGEVFSVKVDGNRVWAGTEAGLVLIENGQVKKVFTMADGLVGRAVMSIAVDEQTGDLWIGTFGGLSHFSGGKFKNYTNLSSGLANDLVYSVLPQGQYIWVATAA